MAKSALDTINAFFEPYRPNRYAKGQVFLLTGEQVDYIYYLLEGRVRVYTISYKGDEVVLHVHQPPDLFPMSHVFDRTANYYIYEADSEAVVQKAPISKIQELLKSHPSVTLSLLKQSYQYINGFLERQSLLMVGSAKRKVLFELVVQCQRFSDEITEDGYVLDIHEKELATRTGLSRETINREIQKLKRENLLTLNHRQIIIPHVSRLKEKLERSI